MTPPTCILVTGANAGLGKECARQLGLKDGVVKVLLACRDSEKAVAAKTNLEESTQKQDMYEIVIMDMANLNSIRNAVDGLQGQTIDGLVLNAGGGGGKEPAKLTADGVTSIVATNLLGHAYLVDLLIDEKILSETASVVYSGSEAARGMPGAPQLELKSGSVDEFVSLCDGSLYNKPTDNMYGPTKLMAALWMNSMARKYPRIRFVTMSPGFTTGTNVFQTTPIVLRTVMTGVAPIMRLFGQAHNVEVGAKRYMDALYDEETYQSGIFYASAKGASGDVCNQACFIDVLDDENYQDHCNEAIHSFLK